MEAIHLGFVVWLDFVGFSGFRGGGLAGFRGGVLAGFHGGGGSGGCGCVCGCDSCLL